MKFFVSLLASLSLHSLFVLAQLTCDLTTVGTHSGVICVSKTQFILNAMDDPKYDALECPAGQVCADIPEICSPTADALCRNSVGGLPGTCAECRDTFTAHKVCVSETEYAICNQDSLLQMRYTCPTAKPRCKYEQTKSDLCTTSKQDLDCPDRSLYDGIFLLPPLDIDCSTEGLFPDTRDTSCKKYYKCAKNENGTFDRRDFLCATTDFFFNPHTQRCELNYKC